MSTPRNRRLAAVWVADIAGHGALSTRNEDAGFAVIDALKEVAPSPVEAEAGRVVKYAGDSVLATFDSTDAALQAAFTLLKDFSEHPDVAQHGLTLRIGMHLGEIVDAADGDVYGDGVNVASRIESLAQPGHIVVSDAVFQQIRNRTNYATESLGARELKGVDHAIEIFTVWRPDEAPAEGEGASRSEPPAHDPLPERYEMIEEEARGGMATVYRARDTRYDREVAVKVLAADYTKSVGHERFLREIDVGAKLQHPNILALLDSGEHEGLLYYVLPFVRGDTIRDRLNRSHQLGIAETIQIGRQVAQALQYAHDQGVIHRDVKPENIMLSGDHAFLVDFGISQAQLAGEGRITQGGLSVGTPAYMSPEQADQERPVDGRSDIYSLGCVLYEMLSGDPPFRASSTRVLLSRHAKDPPPPLRSVRDTVPVELETTILRCLAKSAADRFERAAEVAKALGQAPQAPPAATLAADTEADYDTGAVRSSLFSELKKRKVVHALAAYVVVALAILEFTDYVFGAVGAPAWVSEFLVMASIVGLMVTPVVAWTYNLTRKGLVRVTPTGITMQDLPGARAMVSRATLAVAAVIAIAAFAGLYGPAYRDLGVVGTIDRSEAKGIGGDFMTSMGASGSFDELIRRNQRGAGLTFAQSQLGLRAARMHADELGVVSWEIRWYQAGEVEEWRVEVAGDGSILGFEHTLEETAEGATPTEDEALAIALEFLSERGWSEQDLEQTAASSQEHPNRTDHTFDWDVISGQIPRSDGDGEPGKNQITVRVSGDAMARYDVSFAVPDDFSRARSRQSNAEGLMVFGAIFILVIWAVVRVVIHFRRGDLKNLQWKAPLIVGGGFLVGVAGLMVSDRSDVIFFDLDASGSFVAEATFMVAIMAFVLLMFAAMFTVLTGITQALARIALPGQLEGYRAVMRGEFGSPDAQAETYHGLLLAFIMVTFGVAGNLFIGAFPEGWSFSESLWGEFAGYSPPIVAVLAMGIFASALAIVLLFFVTLLYGWTKSKAVAVLLAATIPSFAVSTVEPVYVGGTVVAVGLLILLTGMMRWGLWAAMLALYADALLTAGGHLIESGLVSLQVQGAMAIVLAILPWILISQVGEKRDEGELAVTDPAGG